MESNLTTIPHFYKHLTSLRSKWTYTLKDKGREMFVDTVWWVLYHITPSGFCYKFTLPNYQFSVFEIPTWQLIQTKARRADSIIAINLMRKNKTPKGWHYSSQLYFYNHINPSGFETPDVACAGMMEAGWLESNQTTPGFVRMFYNTTDFPPDFNRPPDARDRLSFLQKIQSKT